MKSTNVNTYLVYTIYIPPQNQYLSAPLRMQYFIYYKFVINLIEQPTHVFDV